LRRRAQPFRRRLLCERAFVGFEIHLVFSSPDLILPAYNRMRRAGDRVKTHAVNARVTKRWEKPMPATSEKTMPKIEPTIGGSVYVKPSALEWGPRKFGGLSIKG